MMKPVKIRVRILFIIGLTIIMLTWQFLDESSRIVAIDSDSLSDFVWKATYVKAVSPPLVDNDALYGDDAADIAVEDLFITVLPQMIAGEETANTFAKMNAITDHDQPAPEFPAIVSSTPDFAPAANSTTVQPTSTEPATSFNATITLRGQSSILSKEKSYKIKFNKNGGNWHGFTDLFLNKHPFDHSRIRNKIAFDILEAVPNINSLRTRWVHLMVKDTTSGNDTSFRDYGLYEFIERTDKNYLKARNLDENGVVFKANEFEFFRYENVIKAADDPGFDAVRFSQMLELKAGDPALANSKLIRMLTDLNNYNLDIDEVLDRYFNRENYFTYKATQILMGNFDSMDRNFYLYSPHDSLTWYFLPWDYDGSFYYNLHTDYQDNVDQLFGVSLYWGIVLDKRVFSKPNNVEELNRKIDEVYSQINCTFMSYEIDKYMPIAEKYSLADIVKYEKIPPKQFYVEIERIRYAIELSRFYYYSTLENPMPVYLGNVEKTDDGYLFPWSDSYDLQSDPFSYKIQISLTPRFEDDDIVYEKSRITSNFYMLKNLDPGTYFWRVLITDSKNNTQRPFDWLVEDGIYYYGLKKIEINS